MRFLADFADLGWLRATMLKLENQEKKRSENRRKKRVKVVCQPHNIKFYIEKNKKVSFFLTFFFNKIDFTIIKAGWEQ